MSTTELQTVTLEVDGREVVVPKGTPLVLAAASRGIEIPIFCYEPRLGPAVGACRMCLVEVEGMPKLQAACTMTATDGMKVHTKNERAADAQKSVLEFLLINHPLDCPVCDKGGECPLQDLTFRYGPGNTRFRLAKRTYEKPVPISPLIALDRERCILCYRCTRFSSDVSQDEQLVARERGSRSIIATFEERPYANPFSGNVTELCPVGALTTTGYRFTARPWEIDNIPTVCGLCPTGCNTWATTREDRVRRVLSRDKPDVDEGWLCDKGRFAFEHVRADDRYLTPLVRGERGLDDATWEAAAETVARRLRHFANLYGRDAIAVVASGEQSNEEAFGWREAIEAVGGGALAGSGRAWELLEPYRATIADIERADVIVVAGDREPRELAGVVELRIRKAVKAGARLVLVGVGGTQLDLIASERIETAPGAVAASAAEIADRLSTGERPVLLVTDPLPLDAVAAIAGLAGLADRPGGVLPLPEAPNELGVRAAGFRDDPLAVLDRAERGELHMLVLLGDADVVSHGPLASRWRDALTRVESIVVSSMFPNEAALWASVILPATATLEKEGTTTNLEGRVQRLRPTLPPASGVVSEIAFLGELGRQLGAPQPEHVAAIHRRLAAAEPERFPGWAASAAPAAPARSGQAAPSAAREHPGGARPVAGTLEVVAYRPLLSGPAVERAARLQFQRPDEIVLAAGDAERLGLEDGQRVVVAHPGGRTSGPLRVSRTQTTGAVRVPWTGAPVSGIATVGAEGVDVPDGFILSAVKAFALVNILMGFFAIMTVTERKVIGRLQERHGPNRVGPIGLLQPIADLGKLAQKQHAIPSGARDRLFLAAPFVSLFCAIAAFAVIPFGGEATIPGTDWKMFLFIGDSNVGILYIAAIGSMGFYGMLIGGWASGSKYSLLGGLRAVAQLVSYEVAFTMSILGVVMQAQTLSLNGIVYAQKDYWYIGPQIIGFVVFFIAALAESNRPPFDLAEADGEIVAGFHTEYGGLRYAMFANAEFVEAITLSALGSVLFLGGWRGPILPGPLWMLIKMLAILFVFIWIRATLPRLRYDRLMKFGWKVLLPVATLNLVGTAAWVALS